MESGNNKRKINPPRRPTARSPSPTVKEAPTKHSAVADSSVILEQAKNLAVAQAQQEGCTANFRLCDSQFGNFLLPVIPTRAELSDSTLI